MRADKYRNFAELAAAEDPGSYRIVAVNRGSAQVLLAPHGGGIEPGTSEIALAIAGDDVSLYLFEGRKAAGNRDLHITSTNFDEPQGRQLVAASQVAVAVHGEASDAGAIVYLGGRDAGLIATLQQHLEQDGFDVRKHASAALQGTHSENICNRGQSGAGVQLELSKALRQDFFQSLTPKGRGAPRERFYEFVRSMRKGLGLPQ